MKLCTKCGNQLDGRTRFCPRCGAPVPATAVPATRIEEPIEIREPAKKEMPRKTKKSGRKALPIILIAVAIVAVITLVVYLAASGTIVDLFDSVSSRFESSPQNDDNDNVRDDRDTIRKEDPEQNKPTAAPEAEAPTAAVEAPAPAEEDVMLNIVVSEYNIHTAADWWTAFEKDFEATHEHVDLVVDVIPLSDIYDVVDIRISNGDVPDILNYGAFGGYVLDDLLLPVEDYLSEKTYHNFYPTLLEQCTYDGIVWAVPSWVCARAMYYNADILEALGYDAPTTWTEMEELCAVIDERFGGEVIPFGVDWSFCYDATYTFADFAWGNGGDFIDANGNWTLNMPENAEALQFVIDLYENGYTNTDPSSQDHYELLDLLRSGSLAMMIGDSYYSEYLMSSGYNNWKIAPIPSNKGASHPVTDFDCFMTFDNDYSQAELAAITAFYDFLYEDTRYAQWVVSQGYLPTTYSGCVAMVAGDPNTAPWLGILDSARFVPPEVYWSDFMNGLTDVMQQAVISGDAQTGLDELQAMYGD